MIRGLYVAAEGMAARQKAQDAIANNLANLNTTGFKADRPAFATVYERQLYRVEGTRAQPIGALSAGAILRELYTDSQQGALTTTGNPLDAAIDGAGFFAVQTAQGVRYTRNGAFQLDASGTLTTRAGNPRPGREQPAIRVPPNATVQIGEDGSVLANGHARRATADCAGRLAKAPDGDFIGAAQPVANPRVVAGALETSNVSMSARDGHDD
jgi:flagellar basal-body rod protein FlgF